MEMETDQSESPVITNDLSPDISSKVAGPKVGIVKEIRTQLGGDSFNKDRTCSTHDLVEQMEYLYVRVVKARGITLFGRDKLFAEVKVGNHKGITLTTSSSNPEWNQVFAFSKDCIQSSTVEIFVKERYKTEYMGQVLCYLSEVPRRVASDSQLKPQWYGMEVKKGDGAKFGELMLSIWFGTQADEAFSEAWLSNAADVHSCIQSRVYLSPKLWCLRVLIIEAQDIMPAHRGSDIVRFPQFSANVQLGDQCRRTVSAAPSSTRSFSNPYWNEELLFVVAEPFENDLLITIEDQVEPGRDIVVARVLLPMAIIEKRADEKPVGLKWFDVDNQSGDAGDKNKPITKFVSRIHMRVSFIEGYNMFDEDAINNNDVRPDDNRLKKPQIGVLEMGILGATGLLPMRTNHSTSTSDAYCVAKYGGKWVRTRTVVGSLSPKWNEQYVWEVYDPYTVVTIGVFQNYKIRKINTNDSACDSPYGKIKIRLSTLETNRVYPHLSHSLYTLHPSGVKRTGELQLAVRFSCTNVVNMLYKYTIPVLPKVHYVNALSVDQLSKLRYEAVNVVATRLSGVELPLGRDVVEYMLDNNSSPSWSLRRSKAGFFRIMGNLSSLITIVKWLQLICNWQKPMHSVVFLIIFLTLVMLPKFIVPAIFFYLAFVGIWNYRYRPRHPPYMDTRLSHVEFAHPDELDEEFDTFPTSKPIDLVRMRYDRLRSILGRLQTVAGDLASVGERFEALLSWRDPRATFFFVMFCSVAAIGLYIVPIQIVVVLLGLYLLRPPWLRSKLPCRALMFFWRLPNRVDSFINETAEYESLEVEGLLITNMMENFQQCIKLFM